LTFGNVLFMRIRIYYFPFLSLNLQSVNVAVHILVTSLTTTSINRSKRTFCSPVIPIFLQKNFAVISDNQCSIISYLATCLDLRGYALHHL